MDINTIVIPLVIIVTAVMGTRYTKQGVETWYKTIQKPSWTPKGSLIGSIWTFIYITTGLAVMWYWNVPLFSWTHYITGGVLLLNAFLNAYWSKVYFVEHNISRAYAIINIMNATTIIATVLMYQKSPIAAGLMLPYIAWVTFATYLLKNIKDMNKLDTHE